jgi:hypothetical protein
MNVHLMATNKGKSKKKSHLATLPQLQTVRDQSKKQHHRAKNTTDAYRRYKKNGDDFLRTLVANMRSGTTDDKAIGEDISIDDFAVAFKNPPNRYSAQALEAFLVQKCIVEGLGVATKDGIHAAFKRFWDDM